MCDCLLILQHIQVKGIR
uniref:Uncharacterized protein n=1 Tax=Rhizophora mucronata TaxID=61149 RepID=A0A2P2NDR8_RHIMU